VVTDADAAPSAAAAPLAHATTARGSRTPLTGAASPRPAKSVATGHAAQRAPLRPTMETIMISSSSRWPERQESAATVLARRAHASRTEPTTSTFQVTPKRRETAETTCARPAHATGTESTTIFEVMGMRNGNQCEEAE
jgi:hypothetical protein